MKKQHFTDQNRIFYHDGYKVGQAKATDGLSPEMIVEGLAEIHQAIDGLIDALENHASKSGIRIDCAKGCQWCCHQAVFANNLEILDLLEYFSENFSARQISTIAQRAALKNRKMEALSEAEILNTKAPCPLLEEGICLAYDARPMACRIYLSTKVSTCIEFYRNPENPASYPALLDFPIRAGRMLNEGFAAAISQNGQPVSEYRIEEGLDIFMNQRKKTP